MNFLKISVESTQLETRKAKETGNPYQLQTAWVHLVDDQGNPDRYPAKIKLFPPRDNNGNSVPYPVGEYIISPRSFRVRSDYLDMRNTQLDPLKAVAAPVTKAG